MADRFANRWLALFRACRNWGSDWDVSQLPGRIARDTAELLQFDFAGVYLLGPDGLRLQGFCGEASEATSFVGQVAHQVVSTGKPIFGFETFSKDSAAQSIRSVSCAALVGNRGTLGAIYAHSKSAVSGFSVEDQEFLETLALQAATAVEHASLYQSAITDPLTGLLTHRRFQQEAEHALRRAARTESPLSLILIDLDHFKQLNDSCGHAVGNQCLLQVTEVLRQSVRSTDVLARFGGDEFEILLPDTPLSGALSVAEKLRARISALQFSVKITGTIGVAAYPDNAADAAALFLRADAALYEAKEQGRDRALASAWKEDVSRSPEIQRRTHKAEAAEVVQTGRQRLARSEAELAQASQPVQEQVDGHAVVGRLGSGSSGEVLLVRQPELERDVALKRPLSAHQTPEQTQAFEREAKVTAGLNHPGVITVLTMGRDLDGRRYYTMKPLQGRSLAQILNLRRARSGETLRQYSLGRLLEILQRASETVAFAHEKPVLHLDLTPSNIIVGDHGEVTVIDWGTGVSSSSQRALGASGEQMRLVVGSPRYVAPEQCLPEQRITPAADVFALGAILYELLVGRAPFEGQSTKETVEALLAGRLSPPDMAAPEEGIDPTLSELCMKALQRDPQARPTAQEFAERLGRYVRRETEWIVTRFGEDGRQLREDDWVKVRGDFRLVDGEWYSPEGESAEHIVLWKTPVQGSFRFIAEGWIEKTLGEMTLLGRVRADLPTAGGYSFHAAAEWNGLCKLQRNFTPVEVIAPWKAVPGQRYRLELEYNELEGWVRCYIDGQRVMSFRELFSFPGSHIGFYSYAYGAHMKPLEVHRQVWGLQVPAIHSADNMFRHGSYEAALERYNEIAERLGSRLEGTEARLKAAVCLLKLSRIDEGRQQFQALHNSALAAHALALEAKFDLSSAPQAEPRRGVALLERLYHDLQEAKGRSLINEAVKELPRYATDKGVLLSAVENARLRSRVLLLSAHSHQPPASSQLLAYNLLIAEQMQLGEWDEALQTARQVSAAIHEEQHVLVEPSLITVNLASGDGGAIRYKFSEMLRWDWDLIHCPDGPLVYLLARRGELRDLLELYRSNGNRFRFQPLLALRHAVLQACLLLGEEQDVDGTYDELIRRILPTELNRAVSVLSAIFGSSHVGLYARYMERYEGLEKNEAMQAFLNGYKAWWQIGQHQDFDKAASFLAQTHYAKFTGYSQGVRILCQIMLHSLGYLKTECARHVSENPQLYLCGAELELAEMFCQRREPHPTAKWAAANWRPEWRLWLACWLEAKGNKAAACQIARSALEPRYLRGIYQPALKRLIARVEPGAAE